MPGPVWHAQRSQSSLLARPPRGTPTGLAPGEWGRLRRLDPRGAEPGFPDTAQRRYFAATLSARPWLSDSAAATSVCPAMAELIRCDTWVPRSANSGMSTNWIPIVGRSWVPDSWGRRLDGLLGRRGERAGGGQVLRVGVGGGRAYRRGPRPAELGADQLLVLLAGRPGDELPDAASVFLLAFWMAHAQV